MADLFSVTAPLMIRLPSGERQVMAECFRHPQGLVYFELFWHLRDPRHSVHLVAGAIDGDGPWKVGDCVVHVLGCHGSDALLASEFDEWRQYLAENPDEYPPQPLIEAIARRHGAITAGAKAAPSK